MPQPGTIFNRNRELTAFKCPYLIVRHFGDYMN